MSGSVDIELGWPDREPYERNATQAQCLSVARFYTILPDGLGAGQAHALLSYRNFARAAVEAALRLDPEERTGLTLTRMLAGAISGDERLSKAAVEWSEHNFEWPDQPVAVEDCDAYDRAVEIVTTCAEQLLS